jgi:hypothetical protein
MKNNYYFCQNKKTFLWDAKRKKERQTVEKLFSTAMTVLVPGHILECFEMWDAQESRERWVIEMHEKEGRIPDELSGYDDVDSA